MAIFGITLGQLAGSARSDSRHRSLSVERLEDRIALAADGLVEVGTQPSGALDGKIVYLHGGHGYFAYNQGSGGWDSQRELLIGMAEDLGNKDQMDYLADYLFRSGATVAPLRPVGHQSNEVILDNDDPGVTFHGAWSDSSSSIYFGSPGDVPYRYASTAATETAYARYQPNIPEAGHYPVYTWARYGSDRATDQLYRVHHSGGTTEVTINHRRVGNGPVYLGTYYFEAGSNGYVDISNRSSDSGSVVIADMIRFGNGRGDIDRGGGISGYDREDEAGLYWVQWHVDRSQGIATSEYRTSANDRAATVSLAPRYAEYMNRQQDGALSDRVLVSYHSNGGNGNSRGVLGLYNGNGNPNTATPNQFNLANILAKEVNDDLVAQNGAFEHDWEDNGSDVTLDRSDIEFGEINNLYINNEFDATIIETGFHDNQQDAQMLRDPKVRDAIARATYQGMLKYFNSIDGGATSTTPMPGRVDQVAAESTGSGSVTLTWSPPTANAYAGGQATSYIIYASTNGYGFDGGTVVAGGATTTHTLTDLDPSETYYFNVVAQNSGGQSVGSEVIASIPNGADAKVLIVNGFDRLGRSQNPTQPFLGGGDVERVRPRQSNSFDYAVQMASAIAAANNAVAIDTASNEFVASGAVNLDTYDAVFWILGEESSADDTYNAAEQTQVSQYLAQGGQLFLSGAEIGWDLDNLNNGRSFYNNTLKADYVADDAGTYAATGIAGSIFAGIDLNFDNGQHYYDAEFPDVINPSSGGVLAMNYTNSAGGAAVQYDAGPQQQKVVMLAFPFETIVDVSDRTAVMQRVLEFFDLEGESPPTSTVSYILNNDDGAPTYSNSGSWFQASSGGYEDSTYRFAFIGNQAVATWAMTIPYDGAVQVFVQSVAESNNATASHFEIETTTETTTATVDQSVNHLQWMPVGGVIDVAAGVIQVRLDAGASTGQPFSKVVADAVRIDLIGPPPSTGDFNRDGIVDAIDYAVWRNALGQSVTPGEGADGNYDGTVDALDYQIWRSQYGQVTATAQEPAPAVALEPQEDKSGVDNTPRSAAFADLGSNNSPPRLRGPKGVFSHQRVRPERADLVLIQDKLNRDRSLSSELNLTSRQLTARAEPEERTSDKRRSEDDGQEMSNVSRRVRTAAFRTAFWGPIE